MCVDQQVLIMCVLIVLLRHENEKEKQTFYIWKIKVNYTRGKKKYYIILYIHNMNTHIKYIGT